MCIVGHNVTGVSCFNCKLVPLWENMIVKSRFFFNEYYPKKTLHTGKIIRVQNTLTGRKLRVEAS